MGNTALPPPMSRLVSGSWVALCKAILLGGIYYLLASPAAHLSMAGSHAAVIWPAPTIAVVVLWTLPWKQWLTYLLAVFVAMVYVGALDSLPLDADIGFAVLNVVEVSLCAYLGQRFVSPRGTLENSVELTRFLLLLPLAGCMVVALAGATLATLSMNAGWLYELRVFVVGNGLALLVVVPALLFWRRAVWPSRRSIGIAGLVLALLLLSALPGFSPPVMRAALALLLVTAAIQGGIQGASLAVLVAAVTSIALDLNDVGVYSQYRLNLGIWYLQVDLAGLSVLSYYVAVITQERQRIALQLDMARRFEAMGMLAGGIAHDFNNILGAVGGYAETASDKMLQGQSPMMALTQIEAAVARGRDLTETILLAARRGDAARTIVDLSVLAREATALAKPLCRPDVMLHLIQAPAPLPVMGNHVQLIRAVLNLVRNASQAARTEVSVSLHRGTFGTAELVIGEVPTAGEAAWITVTDDGPGIAAQDLPYLFDAFFTTRSGDEGGTGLGLAIVAGVAAQHGGGVVVNSTGGTQFSLVLPLSRVPLHSGANTEPFGNGRRVLVADDNAPFRMQLEDWLAELGFEPVGYSDGQQALSAVLTSPLHFDLLLVDQQMPFIMGDAMLASTGTIAPGVPAILCSGVPDLATRARAAGAVALSKPITRTTLETALRIAFQEKQ